MTLFGLLILQVAGSATTSSDLRQAISSCDQAAFTEAAVSQSQQLRLEQSSILDETQKLIEDRTALQDRRERRRRNGPLAGVFNSDTNEVMIARAERSIQERQQLLSDRRNLLSMRADLLRSQIEIFQLSCRNR